MKNKPVRLTVTGVASHRDQEDEALKITTFGTLSSVENGYKLRYLERGSESREAHKVTLTMNDGIVTLVRDSTFGSDMIFEKGRRYEGSYRTPFGRFSMGIYPTRVDYQVNQSGSGQVNLRYLLDIQGQYASSHQLEIAFETKKSGRA